MKPAVIREMTTSEIVEQIEDQKLGYGKLKMAHVISPLENPHELKAKRKNIARMSTELRQRQIRGNTNTE